MNYHNGVLQYIIIEKLKKKMTNAIGIQIGFLNYYFPSNRR